MTADVAAILIAVLASVAGYGALTQRVKQLEADVAKMTGKIDALHDRVLESIGGRRKSDH